MALGNLISSVRSAFSPSAPKSLGPTTIADLAGAAHEPCRLASGKQLLSDPLCEKLLKRIEANLGVTPSVFRIRFLPLYLRACEFYQLLPAARLCHHRQPGGSIIHGLETCLHLTTAISSSQIDAYMPRQAKVLSGDREEYHQYARLILSLMALVHDVGKIRTDVEIELYDADGKVIATRHPYSPHAGGGIYSQTLPEFVQTHVDPNFRSVSYMWKYRKGRLKNGHDADWAKAIEGLLTTTQIGIPTAIGDAYLDRQSKLDLKDDLWRRVLELKSRADSRSVQQYLETTPAGLPVGRFDLPPDVVASYGMIEWLASHGYLDSMTLVGGSFFLSMPVLRSSLGALPDFDDFGHIPRHAGRPELTLAALRDAGLTTVVDNAGNPLPEYSIHEEERGMFLRRSLTGDILDWRKLGSPDELVNEEQEREVISGEAPPADTQHIPPPEPDDPGPDDSESENIASYGVPIPSAEEESEPEAFVHSLRANNRKTSNGLSNLEPTYHPALLTLGRYIQRFSVDDIEQGRIGVLENGQLTLSREEVDEGLGYRHRTLNFEEFSALCAGSVSDRWVVLGECMMEGIRLSERYTSAILDPTSTDMLLFPMHESECAAEFLQPPGQQPEDNHPPSRPLHDAEESRDASVEADPPQDEGAPDPESNTFDLEYLCEFLSNPRNQFDRRLFNRGKNDIRISLKLLDHISQDTSLRQGICEGFEKRGAITRRSKNCIYLSQQDPVIQQWLDRLPS